VKGTKHVAAVICVAAAVLAGCNETATAKDQQESKRGAETSTAHSVEFYTKNFAERLNAEARCKREPGMDNTKMCINVRKAVNAINAKLGMQPTYPEVGNGSR